MIQIATIINGVAIILVATAVIVLSLILRGHNRIMRDMLEREQRRDEIR